jgi:ABC-type transport system involved in multi-copper enzyme maturation permease subunit
MAILTIARLTLREASRRRLVLAVFILTAILGVLTGWAFHRLLQLPCSSRGGVQVACSASELRIIAATLLILLAFMFSFVLAVGAAFVGAPTIATDIESGVLLAVLPRPIRRSDVVLGKWLGLGTLIAAYGGLACGMEFVIAKIALGYVPPHPVIAIVFLVAEALTVLTLTLAASTKIPAMTCGIVVVVLFGLTWMSGIAGAVGAAFHTQAIENVGTVGSLIFPTDGLWRAAIYNLEPVAVLAAGSAASREASGNPFFVTSGPSTAYLLWALGWGAVVLSIAVWSFSRREL